MRLALVLVLLLATPFLAGCAQDPAPGSGTTPNGTASGTPAATTSGTPANGGSGQCVSTDGTHRAKNPVVVFDTTQGTIRLTLFCDKAPVTTQHIEKLVEAGCYDGTRFHRVVRGFMDQGGDPLSKDDSKASSWGTGGPANCNQSPDTIVEEYYCTDGTISTATPAGNAAPTQCDAHGGLGLKHQGAGVWSMARTSVPHSSGSQFFLTAADAAFLDGRYTVFGHTADDASTQVVLKINNLTCKSQPCQDPNSRTDTLVTITKATVEWG
ncbi:MAG TPA: peptidylprolyl isomerase [Candidatus Thermoplasmatota archaeon]|nr:peptidylprolyl isomerase [Candidatus Thermoplasmatota archaeon]